MNIRTLITPIAQIIRNPKRALIAGLLLLASSSAALVNDRKNQGAQTIEISGDAESVNDLSQSFLLYLIENQKTISHTAIDTTTDEKNFMTFNPYHLNDEVGLLREHGAILYAQEEPIKPQDLSTSTRMIVMGIAILLPLVEYIRRYKKSNNSTTAEVKEAPQHELKAESKKQPKKPYVKSPEPLPYIPPSTSNDDKSVLVSTISTHTSTSTESATETTQRIKHPRKKEQSYSEITQKLAENKKAKAEKLAAEKKAKEELAREQKAHKEAWQKSQAFEKPKKKPEPKAKSSPQTVASPVPASKTIKPKSTPLLVTQATQHAYYIGAIMQIDYKSHPDDLPLVNVIENFALLYHTHRAYQAIALFRRQQKNIYDAVDQDERLATDTRNIAMHGSILLNVSSIRKTGEALKEILPRDIEKLHLRYRRTPALPEDEQKNLRSMLGTSSDSISFDSIDQTPLYKKINGYMQAISTKDNKDINHSLTDDNSYLAWIKDHIIPTADKISASLLKAPGNTQLREILDYAMRLDALKMLFTLCGEFYHSQRFNTIKIDTTLMNFLNACREVRARVGHRFPDIEDQTIIAMATRLKNINVSTPALNVSAATAAAKK